MLLVWHMWFQAWEQNRFGYYMFYPARNALPDASQEPQSPTSTRPFAPRKLPA